MNSRSGQHSTATKERTAPAANKYQRWTFEDDEKLKRLSRCNYSVAAIAQIMNRTKLSIKNRLTLLNKQNSYNNE